MELKFELKDENGETVGTLCLEGRFDEPIVKKFFYFIVDKVGSRMDERAE